jgi:hypothetical protein
MKVNGQLLLPPQSRFTPFHWVEGKLGPHNRSGRSGEKIFPSAANRTAIPPSCSLVCIFTELYRVLCIGHPLYVSDTECTVLQGRIATVYSYWIVRSMNLRAFEGLPVAFHEWSITNIRESHFSIFFILSGVRLSPLGIAANTGLLYQPQMIDHGDCEAIRGMKIDRGI